MARVTVEDCVQQIPNRFELVLMASKRARKLATGAVQACVEWENDKPTVLALREIAAGFKFTDEEENNEEPEVTFGSPATKPSLGVITEITETPVK